MPDQPLVDAVSAGAILIEKVNLAELADIQNIIRQQFQAGLHGAELGKAIHAYYGFAEGEARPRHEWEKPSTS